MSEYNDSCKNIPDVCKKYIIENHESIPKQNEKIILGDYEFIILLVSDTRIETVKIKSLKPIKKKD